MSDPTRLWTLFRELADLDTAAREARLSTLDEDTVMRDRLRSMLAADDASPDSGAEDETNPRMFPWPGDSVGAYRLVAPIGDGGMGSVWLANSRTAPHVSVAIKFPTLDAFESAQGRARLEQEGRILASLNHPNIVSIVDAGETAAGLPYCVLHALSGRPLDAFVREQKPSLPRTAALIGKVADALDHVHRRGFVHRDVKPANVVVTDGDWPVLLDFGAARVTDEADISAIAVTIGYAPRTPAFASPEQGREEEATIESDVYGLGALARFVLADCLVEASPNTRRAIERTLARALDPEPQARFQRAGDFARALHDAATPARPSVWRRAAAMTLVAIGLGAGWWLRGPLASDDSTGVEGTMASVLEDVPSVEIPIDRKTLAAIARQRGSAGLQVAAAAAHARHGEVEYARDTALHVLATAPDLPDQRRIELAGLATQMGLGGAALAVLAGVEVEALPFDSQHIVALLVSTNRSRIAQRTDWSNEHPGEDVLEVLEDLEHEFEPDEALELHHGTPEMHAVLHRIALGNPELVEAWLDTRGGDEPAIHYSTPELGAFLELHARLVDDEHAKPYGDSGLREIERELSDRSGTPKNLPVRAWAWCRSLRVRGMLRGDPGRAAALALAGVKRVRASAWAPKDVEARLLALQAAATSRTGVDATEVREAALAAARIADPHGTEFLVRIDAIARSHGTEMPRLTEGVDDKAPRALARAIREHADDGGPWWMAP